MKLGKDTGNVRNWMMSGCISEPKDIEEGMDVTFLLWTDRMTGQVRAVEPRGGYVAIRMYDDCYDCLDDNDPKRNDLTSEDIILQWYKGRWYEIVPKYVSYDYGTGKAYKFGQQRKKTNVVFGIRDGYRPFLED